MNSDGGEKQTDRTPVSREAKEKKREDTRKQQKTGNERK